VKTASEMTYTVSGGALNSTQTKPKVFCKKVENKGFFVKKVGLSLTHGALCTVSVFFILHFTTHPPPAHGPSLGQLGCGTPIQKTL